MWSSLAACRALAGPPMRAKPAIPRLPTRHRRVGGARPGLLGADASSWVARGWVNEYGDEYEDIDEDDDLDVRRRGVPRVGRSGAPPRRGARPPPPGGPRAQPPRQRASSSEALDGARRDDDDDEGSQVVMETVQCRSEQEIGRVIGRGGSTVERIQATTRTKIQVDSRTLCVDVKGRASDVREAARIVALVAQEGFGGSVERVPCTGSEGAIIGPKGARIRAIAKETRARLEVQVSDDGKAECVIRGSPPEVAAAAEWVRELVANDRDERDAARRAGKDRGGWHRPYGNDEGDYAEYAELESPTWDEGRGRGGVRDWDSYTRPMRNPPLPFGYDERGERIKRGRVKRRESGRGAGRARGREG